MQSAEAAEAFKQQGNEQFCKGEYIEAIQLYTRAIELDSTNHVSFSLIWHGDMSWQSILLQLLFGNRAAAHYKNGAFEEAAADSNICLQLQPSWSKGHVRLAQALERLGRWEEAATAAQQASELEPNNAFVGGLAARIATGYFHVCLKAPLNTPADFLRAFCASKDVRLRLATLATFWNACSKLERHAVFAALLPAVQASCMTGAAQVADIVGGGDAGEPPSTGVGALQQPESSQPPAAAASGGPEPSEQQLSPTVLQSLRPGDVPPAAMVALPMHNYTDVALPSEWLHWFGQLPSAERASVFSDAWDACTAQERQLVAGDMVHFLQSDAPVSSDEDGAGAARADPGKHGTATAASGAAKT